MQIEKVKGNVVEHKNGEALVRFEDGAERWFTINPDPEGALALGATFECDRMQPVVDSDGLFALVQHFAKKGETKEGYSVVVTSVRGKPNLCEVFSGRSLAIGEWEIVDRKEEDTFLLKRGNDSVWFTYSQDDVAEALSRVFSVGRQAPVSSEVAAD
jgi:hypothetical protein